MSRFVILSFLGLGFAFYELSGGADFEPPVRTAQPSPIAVATPVETTPATPAPAATPDLVQQASITTAPTTPRAGAAEVTAQLQTAALVADGKTRLTLATEGLQLASLEGGLGAGTVEVATAVATVPEAAVATPVVAPQDIRAVRASRVNMRQGPGTNFPILNRLLAGDKVEVLRDEGAGWAKLRVEKTGQVGWIATSLLSPKGS